MQVLRYRKVIIIFASLCLLVLIIVGKDKPIAEVIKQEDRLLETIKAKAPTYAEAPKNAYIDNVWKKTPGRNGLKVNVEKSYKKMKKTKRFDEKLLVFDEISPQKTLTDLAAAPIYRGHPDKQMVTLLINVSWGEAYIPAILETLKKHQVKATFFLEGKWAQTNKKTAMMIVEQGHEIGNHAYNHPDMQAISNQEKRKQIVDTNQIIEAITDKKPVYFAPPSGSYNDTVVEIAAEENMETILWTVDTIDWQNPPVSVMINRVIDKVYPGAMILMHPTNVIARGLDDLIKELMLNQYKISIVSDLLSEKR